MEQDKDMSSPQHCLLFTLIDFSRNFDNLVLDVTWVDGGMELPALLMICSSWLQAELLLV